MSHEIDSFIFEYEQVKFRARILRDEDYGTPWAEGPENGNGIVSDWVTREAEPGERLLCRDRDSVRYYDIAGTLEYAKRDSWGSRGDDGLSPDDKAARAVDANFEYYRAWCADEWCYVGIEVSPVDEPALNDGLWGLESNDRDYLQSCARDLADELLGKRAAQAHAAHAARKARAERLVDEILSAYANTPKADRRAVLVAILVDEVKQ